MTRILVITNLYPPHHLGGYELSCRDVVVRLRARGHDVNVLTTTMRLPGVDDPTGEVGEGVFRDLTFYWEDHRLVSPGLRKRLSIERANQAALTAAIDRFRPDVVSAWNMGAMSFGLLTSVIERGIPLVLNVCDGWLWYGPKLDAWARLFLRRPRLAKVVRRVTGVPTALPDLGAEAVFCFVSEAIMRWSAERSTWQPRLATVVYSGIERSDFGGSPDARDGRPWRWRLLSVGRLDERKGIHVAIEALSRLPETATLDIVGRGEEAYETKLKTMASTAGVGDRVRFGVSERSELAERYAGADVFVFPTLWEEPFGLVPVEAMACGTPVVAFANSSLVEVVGDGGLLVPDGDVPAMVEAARSLLTDATTADRVAQRGVQRAATFTWARCADETVAVYNELR